MSKPTPNEIDRRRATLKLPQKVQPADRRNVTLACVVTQAEADRAKACWEADGLTQSAWLRERIIAVLADAESDEV